MRPWLTLFLFGLGGCASLDANVCTEDLVETYADSDGDGFGDLSTASEACGAIPSGRVVTAGDCNDSDPAMAPNAAEFCNGLDNNCNGVADDGLPVNAYHADADADGFGDPDVSTAACAQPGGYVVDNTDCNDAEAAAYPGAVEVCDGIDNDCDTRVDDMDPDTDPSTMTEWHADLDGDTYGGDTSVLRCQAPPGAIADGTDCDDTDPDVNPAAPEVCGGGDDNCNGLFDDDDPLLDLLTTSVWFQDGDGDGFGNVLVSVDACAMPSGYVDNPDDCDDADPLAFAFSDWYLDIDGDGFGAGPSVGQFCHQPYPGTAAGALGIDCDDNEPLAFPGNPEVCDDGIDNDCNPGSPDACGLFFEDFEDGDYNGWVVIAAGQVPSVANFGADGSNFSFQMTGGNSGHYDGLYWAFPNETPSVISLYVRAPTNNGAKGYIVFGGSPMGNGTTAVFFKIDGALECYDGNQFYSAPFTPGVWHFVEFHMDWASQRFDFWTDGVQRFTNIPFRGSAPVLQEFHMYNYSNETAYWDEILMTP